MIVHYFYILLMSCSSEGKAPDLFFIGNIFEVKHRWLNRGWIEPFPPGPFPACISTLANIIPSYIQRCLAAD